MAKRQLKLIKTVRTLKDGTIQVELKPAGDKKLRGSELAIVYPEIALWEEGVNDYVYPYFFTSSDNWTIDICTFAPEGYTMAGVYDELGDLMTITNCTQAGLAGETKVIAFETEKTGSPKKFKVKAEIEAAPKGKKGQKVTLETHSEIVKKGKLRRK